MRSCREYAQVEIRHLEEGLYHERISSSFPPLHQPRILDLAAGPGTWEIALQSLHPDRIVWHDRSPEFRRLAQELTHDYDNVSFVLADISDFSAYADQSFDLVICRLALYHARDEVGVLREVMRVLKPGGSLYLESHNLWRDIETARILDWRFLPCLLLPALYAVTGRKLGPTHFHVEGWLRWRAMRLGFERIYWRPITRRTFQALLRRPV
jgi:SAM-dependent methyltransferase